MYINLIILYYSNVLATQVKTRLVDNSSTSSSSESTSSSDSSSDLRPKLAINIDNYKIKKSNSSSTNSSSSFSSSSESEELSATSSSELSTFPYYIGSKKYRNGIMKLLREHYSPVVHDDIPIIEISLRIIYDAFLSDKRSLVLFTSYVIYSTEGFKNYTNPQCNTKKTWLPRGVLSIEGKDNYEKLVELTNDKTWTNNPSELGNFTKKSLQASIVYWNYSMAKAKEKNPKFKLNFYNSLRMLNARELQDGLVKQYEDERNKRLNIYVQVREALLAEQ